jgi:hypothetical protein
MFIILTLDVWNQYEFITDWTGKVKLFSCESEALDYSKIKNLWPFQIIEVTI